MIKNAGFDGNVIYEKETLLYAIGCVDGLVVLVEYSHDYDLQGEQWVGGPVIESVKCPSTGMNINIPHDDEILVHALSEADQTHLAIKSGYEARKAND